MAVWFIGRFCWIGVRRSLETRWPRVFEASAEAPLVNLQSRQGLLASVLGGCWRFHFRLIDSRPPCGSEAGGDEQNSTAAIDSCSCPGEIRAAARWESRPPGDVFTFMRNRDKLCTRVAVLIKPYISLIYTEQENATEFEKKNVL